MADETAFLKTIFEKLQVCSKELELKSIIQIQTRESADRTVSRISEGMSKERVTFIS